VASLWRRAEIAVNEPAHELPVLDDEGPVETELVADERNPRWCRLVAENRAGGITRHEVDEEEDENRHSECDRHELQQPPTDIGRETHVFSPIRCLSASS